MTVARHRSGQFHPSQLFAPASLLVLGADTPEGAQVAANIARAGFAGSVQALPADASPGQIAQLPEAAELALFASAAVSPAAMAAIAARGTRAGIALRQVPDLAALAGQAGLRMLGPSSFGIAVPALNLNASLGHIPVPPGRVALLSQSASLARAVLDWAGPNGVGFSHIIGIGGSADLGFAMALDWLSRDGGTGLILMDVRRVRDRRAFISAARAASRLRPLVAIRPGARLLDPSGEAEAVFEAALHRAGAFVVRHFEELLAAAETLSRARPARSERLAIVTNAIGPGRMAADAAVEAGIELAILPPEAQSALAASLPAELIYGLVYAASPHPGHAAEIAAMLSAVPEVGGVLVVLAPTGPQDDAGMAALAASAATARLPILACVMGETTGAAHRAALGRAGLPVFATPEQAVRAFAHIVQDRRARLAARELPGRRVLEIAPDHAAADAALAHARACPLPDGACLPPMDAAALLAAYGIESADLPPKAALRARLRVVDDAVFGPAISLAAGARQVWEMPPLNLSLAHSLAGAACLPAPLHMAVARLLVRISQMLVDLPELAGIELDPVWLLAEGAVIGQAQITLHAPGAHSQLAISPYPEHLIGTFSTGGQEFIVRPIRPEDAQAHLALMRRLPPEDLRFRFFTAVREISPEQMARLTQIDYEREMAFIAVRGTDQATMGVARLVREPDAPSGEFAIVVEPAAKGLGLASHLMARLADWARGQGLREISGTVLAENHAMLGFVKHLGMRLKRVPGDADLVEAVWEL